MVWGFLFICLCIFFVCFLFHFHWRETFQPPQPISLMIVTMSMERLQRNPKRRTLNCNNDTQRSMELVNDLKYYALNAPILANSGESVDSTCPDQS